MQLHGQAADTSEDVASQASEDSYKHVSPYQAVAQTKSCRKHLKVQTRSGPRFSPLASASPSFHSSVSYLVVAVHGSSNLPAALRSCCRNAVAKGEGLVAMVAGRVLERSLRGGVELQGTLGKKSRSYRLRPLWCMVG